MTKYASMQVYTYMQINAKLSICPQLWHFLSIILLIVSLSFLVVSYKNAKSWSVYISVDTSYSVSVYLSGSLVLRRGLVLPTAGGGGLPAPSLIESPRTRKNETKFTRLKGFNHQTF